MHVQKIFYFASILLYKQYKIYPIVDCSKNGHSSKMQLAIDSSHIGKIRQFMHHMHT